MNERSCRPKSVRGPTTPFLTVQRTVQLRKQYPAQLKYKVTPLLRKGGYDISESTKGRIFKRKGLVNTKKSEMEAMYLSP